VVFTMLMDDPALKEVLYKGKVLESLGKGAIHVSLSTLKRGAVEGVDGGAREARAAFCRRSGVWGGRISRRRGSFGWCWWSSGAGGTHSSAGGEIQPRDLGGRGESVERACAKLGGNFLITAMIASLSEGFVYAEALGVSPEVFLETVNKALFQSPFYEMYGKIMLTPPEKPGATMAVGEKDMRLFREAAQEGQVQTPLADVFMATFHRAFEAGMKDADWARDICNCRKQDKDRDW